MDIQACRLCLSTDSKLYSIDKCGLNLELLSRTSSANFNKFPSYICFLCRAQLVKHNTFRAKCDLAQSLLQDLMTSKCEITCDDIARIQNVFPAQLNITKLQQFNIFDGQEIFPDKPNLEYANQENADFEQEFETNDSDRDECILNKQEYFESVTEQNINNLEETMGSMISKEKLLSNKTVNKSETQKNLNKTLEPPKKRKKSCDYISKLVKQENVLGNYDFTESYNEFLLKKVVNETELQNKVKMNKPTELENEILSKKVLNETGLQKVKINRPQKKLENFYVFAKKHNMSVKFYSEEEQLTELANRKDNESYKNSRLKCEICYKGFISETAFKNHQNTHNPARGVFSCDLCRMYFNKKGARDKHVEEHGVKYTCNQCGDTFTSPCQAINHFDFHSGVKFECETCKKVFLKKTTYFSHMRNSHADVSCDLCGDTFVGSQGLQSHMVKSHREAAKCSTCSMVFLNDNVLKRHVEKSCRIDLKICVRCGDGFSNKEDLVIHLQDKHKNEKRAICVLCSKTFSNEHALSNHWHKFHSERTRNRTRDRGPDSQRSSQHYICDQCGKSFKSKHHFSSHMRLHTGERPFHCPRCPKTFRQPASLKVHVLTHTDARPFKCALCERAFRQASHRTAHMRTHTLEKPYSCSVCQKRFSLAANLREHTRTVHEGLPPKRNRKHTSK